VVSPIGEHDSHLLDQVSLEANLVFGFPTEILPLLDDVYFAFDPTRDQYYSTPILELLASKAPPRAVKVLGVTGVDLFIPILTHVYGEAQLGGKACIISSCRLSEGLSPLSARDDFACRMVKEAVHELGHTFQLRHCKESSCVMHYCRTIRDVDRKSNQLCRYCKILLGDELKRLAIEKPPAS
jgi:archaemetzincin